MLVCASRACEGKGPSEVYTSAFASMQVGDVSGKARLELEGVELVLKRLLQTSEGIKQVRGLSHDFELLCLRFPTFFCWGSST